MKYLLVLLIFVVFQSAPAQNAGRQIADVERAFERVVAEKGIREGFIEFLSPAGVLLMPDAVNGREAWRSRPASPAALTWNPVWIDVSSNGLMAYSIGNSQYRPKGKDGQAVYFGHYLSIWQKQPDGRFLAAFDAGINHDRPSSLPTEWMSPTDIGNEKNPERLSAADSAVGFYEAAAESGASKAYRSFLAEDAIVLRDGKQPAFNRKAAIELIGRDSRVSFAKRKTFVESADLAYVHARYAITDKYGKETEKGNFVQVWKLRKKRWLIVADMLVPLGK